MSEDHQQQLKKFLVCTYFERKIEGMDSPLPGDLVFIVSAKNDQAACDLAKKRVESMESKPEIKQCSSRLLNAVLSNPFYLIDGEGGEAT